MNPFKKVLDMKARTGTRFVIMNWIVTMLLIIVITLNVYIVIPFLAIKYPALMAVLDKLNPASIITALLGQSGASTIANSIRIAIENKKKDT